MSDQQSTGCFSGEPCTHGELHHGSGGFYLMCVACGQSWVAKRRGANADADLDREGTSQTPLAKGNGRYVFIPYAPRPTAAAPQFPGPNYRVVEIKE